MYVLITMHFWSFFLNYKFIKEVKDKLWKIIADEAKIHEDHRKNIDVLFEDATKVSWEMLTLIPPPVLCSPEKFSESHHKMVGKDKFKIKRYRLSYYCPVMLYNAHGSVAVKGIVCKEASNEPTANVDSDNESEGKLNCNFKHMLTLFINFRGD